MKLYYKAGACSLASHIALIEAKAVFVLEAVDTEAALTEKGEDYLTINPKGYVPTLQLTDDVLLTEGAAVLQHIAEIFPAANLAPKAGTLSRALLQEFLNWTSSELHKSFSPLFNAKTTEAGKLDARKAVASKFDVLEEQLSDGRAWLVEETFSVADAYLFVVANWANFTNIDLANWPNIAAFVGRVASRPSSQIAMRAEGLIQ
ncbi:MAG: glutathione transferase GstA [Sneathiellales bacterium]|nr:glutathione transferase GstA [Sneathiellales bacterium]